MKDQLTARPYHNSTTNKMTKKMFRAGLKSAIPVSGQHTAVRILNSAATGIKPPPHF